MISPSPHELNHSYIWKSGKHRPTEIPINYTVLFLNQQTNSLSKLDDLISHRLSAIGIDRAIAGYCALSLSNAFNFFHTQSHGDTQNSNKIIK